jgi:D-alanine-D-alanine ligase
MSSLMNLVILCGGQSTEHEISVVSASTVVAEFDASQYIVSIVYIDHSGAWFRIDDSKAFVSKGPKQLIKEGLAQRVTIQLGDAKEPLLALDSTKQSFAVDCFFPVLHGTQGEDGVIQGMLEMLNIPYVGCDVLSAAVTMDKHTTKVLLRDAGIPTLDWRLVKKADYQIGLYDELAKQFGDTLFIKPATLGSSVGISKVDNAQAFEDGILEAFRFDTRVIIEPCFHGREIECAVLGNSQAIASMPGEIIAHHAFYSYAAKYTDPKGSTTITPADLSTEMTELVQTSAVDAFVALSCYGMARIDFFVSDDTLYINEVNSIPGFTSISMYPKMWAATGLPYAQLLDRLIQLALERHGENHALQRSFTPQAIEAEQTIPLNEL